MPLDLVLRSARLAGAAGQPGALLDIGIRDGRIAAIEPQIAAEAPEEDVDGRLVMPGLVETHIHLDKSCILDRCRTENGTLEEAIAEVAAAKSRFTEEDVYDRAPPHAGEGNPARARCTCARMSRWIRASSCASFNAIRALEADYRWAIDLEICVFPQEGLLNDPGTEELLVEACEQGADLIGGCPYTDTEPNGQIERIFELARRFDLDIDFHLDFDLDPTWMHLEEVCRQTGAASMGWPRRGRPRNEALRNRPAAVSTPSAGVSRMRASQSRCCPRPTCS